MTVKIHHKIITEAKDIIYKLLQPNVSYFNINILFFVINNNKKKPLVRLGKNGTEEIK